MSEVSSKLSQEELHRNALKLSQSAPQYLEKSGAAGTLGLSSFLSSSESLEVWVTYEQLLLSCLRTKDDKSALLCLRKLISRFGPASERLAALQGLYEEATAADDAALGKILSEYETVILNDPTNTVDIPARFTARPANYYSACLKTTGRTSAKSV